MRDYAARAKAVRAGFDMNPSPGNIRDGLITDAMKSAGAAKKGGTSPVSAVLDYTEYSTEPGLNLQCTPGSDVECVTGQVGAGANIVLFTTGLGTPTGKSDRSRGENLNEFGADRKRCRTSSTLIPAASSPAKKTISQMGEEILDHVIQVASGETKTKAELLAQNDLFHGRGESHSEHARSHLSFTTIPCSIEKCGFSGSIRATERELGVGSRSPIMEPFENDGTRRALTKCAGEGGSISVPFPRPYKKEV